MSQNSSSEKPESAATPQEDGGAVQPQNHRSTQEQAETPWANRSENAPAQNPQPAQTDTGQSATYGHYQPPLESQPAPFARPGMQMGQPGATGQYAPQYAPAQAGFPAPPQMPYAPAYGYNAQPQPIGEEEIGYHRLSHASRKTRWWSPLAEGATGVAFYLVLTVVAGVIFGFLLMARDPSGASFAMLGSLDALQSAALSDPYIFAFMFGSVALMFPALYCARLIFGPKPWGLIHSVAGKLRWGWLLTCLGLATAIFLVLPTALDLALGTNYSVAPQAQGGSLIALLVILCVIVPIQCYAEELVFRGYLMQTLGRWLKNPVWAIVLPAPLFMFGHAYDLWGQLSVLSMGIIAGYLTWRTGGLEAAIAIHVVNNMVAMGFGIFGLADPFLQEGSTAGSFIISLITQLVCTGLILWVAHRRKIQRTRTVAIYATR